MAEKQVKGVWIGTSCRSKNMDGDTSPEKNVKAAFPNFVGDLGPLHQHDAAGSTVGKLGDSCQFANDGIFELLKEGDASEESGHSLNVHS